MTEQDIESRLLIDDELRAIPPIRVDAITERNPFFSVIGPGRDVANENSRRWTVVHGWRSDDDAEPVADAPLDPFDVLRDALDATDAPRLWSSSADHPPYSGAEGVALFPHVPSFRADSPARRELEESWEQRCLDMHAEQGSIELEDGEPPEFRGFDSLRRSD